MEEGKIVDPHKKPFWKRHGQFVMVIYQIAFFLGFIYGAINVLRIIFDAIRHGDFWTFAITIVFNSFLMALNAIVFAAIFGTIAVILLFLPYLAIRGFLK